MEKLVVAGKSPILVEYKKGVTAYLCAAGKQKILHTVMVLIKENLRVKCVQNNFLLVEVYVFFIDLCFITIKNELET